MRKALKIKEENLENYRKNLKFTETLMTSGKPWKITENLDTNGKRD